MHRQNVEFLNVEQDIMGRTNRLLFFHTTRTAKKTEKLAVDTQTAR